MSQKIDGPKVLFNCPWVLLNRVDKIAKNVGTTRSETMRIMLETCCDGYEPFMKLGLLKKLMAKRELNKKIINGIQPTLV